MSDTTGNDPQDDRPASGDEQPPAYPPPQNPYGQPQQPFGAPPASPSPYGQQPPAQEPPAKPDQPPPSYTQQYGQQPHGQSAYPQQYAQQGYGQPAYGGYGQPSDRRPATVTVAAVITLVMSGLVLALFTLGFVALAVAREDVVDQMRDTGGLGDVDPNDIISVLYVVFAAFIIWCVIAMVLAVFALRRSNGARIGLVVSSALAAVLSLIAIGSGLSIVSLVACIAVIVCLFTGGAGQWYATRNGGSSHSGLAPPIA